MTLISRIVIGSGSRFDDVLQSTVFERLDEVLSTTTRDELLVIHGGQRGVDTLINNWCIRNGVRVISIPVLFEARGVQDGKERNRFLVTVALALAGHFKTEDVRLEAFPGPKSSGTFHCIRHARHFGINTTVTTEGPGTQRTRVNYN